VRQAENPSRLRRNLFFACGELPAISTFLSTTTGASQFLNIGRVRRFGVLQSQRDCALQPGVGELASLPWVGWAAILNPERALKGFRLGCQTGPPQNTGALLNIEMLPTTTHNENATRQHPQNFIAFFFVSGAKKVKVVTHLVGILKRNIKLSILFLKL
jgi:hypothetical protein